MRLRGPAPGAAAAVTLALLLLVRCGGGSGREGPTAPANPATPAPAPPTPEPPVSASCARLPLGSATPSCRDEGQSFFDDVVQAIDALRRDRPEYFDGEIVLNLGGYYVGLIRILDGKGLCADYDGEELSVKGTNEFSEHYKVLTSWGQIRRQYMGTCYPAAFPLGRRSPAPSPPGCPLPPSTEVACGRPASLFLGDVEASLDQVIRQKPELFDPGQTAPGTDWPLVKDLPAYHAAVVDALVARGYCGKFDGEEVQLKRSNELSEHYDVNLADRYVRRGSGAYRGACYPAAF